MIRNLKILPLVAALVAVGFICSARPAAESRRGSVERQKARFFYMEGMAHDALDDNDAAYELFRRAHQSDPSYAPAAYDYGLRRMVLESDTLQSDAELLRSFGMARPLVEEYPADYDNVEYYAYMAQIFDTIQEAERVLNRLDTLVPDRSVGFLRLSTAFAQNRDFAKALKYLDKYEEKEGMSEEIVPYRSSLYLQAGDTLGALASVQKLLDKDPGNVEYMALKGQLYEAIAQPDSALAIYLAAEKKDPAAAKIKILLADIYNARGDSAALDNKMYEALLLENMDMETKIEMLATYLQHLITEKSDTRRGDYLFEVLNEQYPHEAEVRDLSARYSAAKGDFPKAIEEIHYALDQNMSSADYWGQLMTYLIQADKYKEAMKEYENSRQHVEKNPALALLYATSAFMDKQYPRVIETYTGLIHDIVPELDVNDTVNLDLLRNLSLEGLMAVSGYYTSLGDVYFELKDTTSAFRAYDNSLKIFPDNMLTLNNYAYFLAESGGDLERAAEMSKRTVDNDPENITQLDTYAWVLFRQHNYPEALKYQGAAVEKAEEREYENSDIYMHYGDILFMNGRPDDAITYWKKALEADKKSNDLDDRQRELLKKKIRHKTFFYE